MSDDSELQRMRQRVHDLANTLHVMAVELRSHVAGCTEQNKSVSDSLVRLEAGQKSNNSAFHKFVMLVLGAQAAVLLAIFAAWLAKGGHL